MVNKKYDYFAEFIDGYIKDTDFMYLTKEFDKEEYAKHPEKIITKLREFFKQTWVDNADLSPRTGNPKTQKANFEIFLRKAVLSREKLIYDKPLLGGEKVDFNPLFARYKELTREIVEEPEISPRIAKAVRVGVMEPKKQFNRLKKQIENSAKGNHVHNILAIHKFTERILTQKRPDPLGAKKPFKPMSVEEAYELRQIAEKALEPYVRKESGFSMKSETQLRDALGFKGVDTTQLQTQKQLRDAAKKAHIGLRQWQKNKDEVISEIMKLTGYEKKDLEDKSNIELKDQHKKLTGMIMAPKKKVYGKFDNLPTSTERVQAMYNEHNIVIPAEERKQVRKDLKERHPFLTPDYITKEVNKEMAYRLLKTPTFSKEIESRYMNLKYKDPTRKPTFLDLIEIIQSYPQ